MTTTEETTRLDALWGDLAALVGTVKDVQVNGRIPRRHHAEIVEAVRCMVRDYEDLVIVGQIEKKDR